VICLCALRIEAYNPNCTNSQVNGDVITMSVLECYFNRLRTIKVEPALPVVVVGFVILNSSPVTELAPYNKGIVPGEDAS
jgi:hypothetical protein